ncbi:hypothetical protein BDR03DRAFT_1007459 [Suillus americanus]|nr:hypothetical protein BDR03DRAFT_1007459 [Suillus americanus]
MLRICNDPNFNICPGYTTDYFANTRAQLINEDTTEAQATQLLKNIRELNNNEQEEEQERLDQEQIDEEEASRKEEKKKNKHKYTPILTTGILDNPEPMPCSYALQKLDKGEYVEIWYFTNNGLDKADSKKTIHDDAMILSSLADGSTAWVSSASMCNAKSVVNDENLLFKDFYQACPHFLIVMEQVDWPAD